MHLRASPVGPIPAIELQLVRRPLGANGKRPSDVAVAVSNQEEEVSFKIAKNIHYLRKRDAESRCHSIGLKGPPILPRKLSDGEFPDRAVTSCHELQPLGEVSRKVCQVRFPLGVRHRVKRLTAAYQDCVVIS